MLQQKLSFVLQAALAWLAQQPAVHWLAPRMHAKLHNWQATAVTQCGLAAPDASAAVDASNGAYFPQLDSALHPLWAAGLTGGGQVIGGGDSGVDHGNCYFQDPAVDWQAGLSTDPATGITSFNSTKHRKIRLYVEFADGTDSNGE